MAQVENLERVITALQRRGKALAADDNVQVKVGYAAAYAIYVHENLEAYHRPPTQAKFLEQPAKTFAKELARIVRQGLQKGLKMAAALLLMGLRLQRESQKLCPVDTGYLRNSAFARIEGV